MDFDPSGTPKARTEGRSRVGTREALRFLMEAGQTLASTLTTSARCRRWPTWPFRASPACVVDIVEPDGSVRALGIAHVNPARLPQLQRLVAEVRGSRSASAFPFGLEAVAGMYRTCKRAAGGRHLAGTAADGAPPPWNRPRTDTKV